MYTASTSLWYGANTWSMTVTSKRRLDAFNQWCLRYIVHIPFTAHVTNQEVCSRTGQPPVTSLVKSRRLKLFGHIARAEPAQDHARALRASISLPEDWRRPRDRPRQSWLRTVEADLEPLNFGLHTACRRAADRSVWWSVVETAMLLDGRATSMMIMIYPGNGRCASKPIRAQTRLSALTPETAE